MQFFVFSIFYSLLTIKNIVDNTIAKNLLNHIRIV
ncbi:hypothetical protein KL86DES1_21672 [uncultured Desulfovibrio sp.]|uniref:Uncharacterized protein n=1 Tax=uncultured Desulfovibrio sp. TaxID=167968 RepID=A0A212L8W6_9BACT|nr:hypothetical protein KL86DES1_21672 [uncultured Desulfovibrio sp.]VZH34577.1 conserved protein of unknown function [Desulfovibrio sp. 86]